MYITLTPAYGRDYKSAKAVKQDWAENKDFIIQCMAHPDDGRYCNKQDAEKTKDVYMVRYSKLTKTVQVFP